jgi:2-keto-4-pentenoate hydratase/2-oxohepta-3-ene-1,7-dioic acid hydratase in catechol pathway
MRIINFLRDGIAGLGVKRDDKFVAIAELGGEFPNDLPSLLADPDGLRKLDAAANQVSADSWQPVSGVKLLPPIPAPGKCICVGLNYVEHAAESSKGAPPYPILFTRFANSIIADGEAIERPKVSEKLDWEGELAVIIGRRARHVAKADALDYVAGYSVFNDGSIRDYQRHSPQYFMGKSFDKTGGFGPEFVSADALPPGARGLMLTTRINGEIMQQANTKDMIFDIPSLIAYITEGITLEPGDVIVSGTPAGVGNARKPPIYLRDGDVCEIEIEGIGKLCNPVVDEA